MQGRQKPAAQLCRDTLPCCRLAQAAFRFKKKPSKQAATHLDFCSFSEMTEACPRFLPGLGKDVTTAEAETTTHTSTRLQSSKGPSQPSRPSKACAARRKRSEPGSLSTIQHCMHPMSSHHTFRMASDNSGFPFAVPLPSASSLLVGTEASQTGTKSAAMPAESHGSDASAVSTMSSSSTPSSPSEPLSSQGRREPKS